jgi:hypothetical protein
MGPAASLNRAISTARGKYIARQDGDDISLAQRLELQVRFMEEHPDVALLGSSAIVIDERGVEIGATTVASECARLKWSLLFGNAFVHPSAIMSYSALESVGQYSEDPNTWCVDDYDLWSRIAEKFEVGNVVRPLVKWRKHDSSTSSKYSELQDEQRQMVSERNICRILGVGGDSAEFVALKRLCLWPPFEESLKASHVTLGIRTAQKLLKQFGEMQFGSTRELAMCYWTVSRSWFRHFVGIAWRGDRANGFLARLLLVSGMFWFIARSLIDVVQFGSTKRILCADITPSK